MSILDNTASLQALLEQANSLPVGGDGSGGGAEVKWATGTIPLTAGTKSSGTTIAGVTGLGFKPTHVIVYLKNNFSMSSTSYYGLVFIQSGVDGTSVFVRKYSTSLTYGYSYSSSAYATISLTGDGFALRSVDSSLYTGSSYGYIAIYDDSYAPPEDEGRDDPVEEEIPGL